MELDKPVPVLERALLEKSPVALETHSQAADHDRFKIPRSKEHPSSPEGIKDHTNESVQVQTTQRQNTVASRDTGKGWVEDASRANVKDEEISVPMDTAGDNGDNLDERDAQVSKEGDLSNSPTEEENLSLKISNVTSMVQNIKKDDIERWCAADSSNSNVNGEFTGSLGSASRFTEDDNDAEVLDNIEEVANKIKTEPELENYGYYHELDIYSQVVNKIKRESELEYSSCYNESEIFSQGYPIVLSKFETMHEGINAGNEDSGEEFEIRNENCSKSGEKYDGKFNTSNWRSKGVSTGVSGIDHSELGPKPRTNHTFWAEKRKSEPKARKHLTNGSRDHSSHCSSSHQTVDIDKATDVSEADRRSAKINMSRDKHASSTDENHSISWFGRSSLLYRGRFYKLPVPTATDLTCKFCNKRCNTWKSLKEHERIHTNMHACPKCEETFKTRDTAREHSKFCMAVPQYARIRFFNNKERVLMKSGVSNVKALSKGSIKGPTKGPSQGNVIQFPCKKCGRKFKFRMTLSKHLCTGKLETRPAKVPVTPSLAKTEKKYICNTDKLASTCAYSMDPKVQHKKIVDTKCPQCGKQFQSTGSVRRHMLVHIKGRFKCPYCALKFHFHKEMLKHATEKHGKTFLSSKSHGDLTQKGKLRSVAVTRSRL